MFEKIDNFFLRCADEIVLFAWNQFEVRKAILIRILLLVWVIVGDTIVVYNHSLSVVTICIDIFLLIFAAAREYIEANTSYETLNRVLILTRDSSKERVYRYFFLTLAIWAIFDFLGRGLITDILQSIILLAAWVMVVLQYALNPTDPPKRKEPKQIAVLQPDPI
jgi:hypothetical protein